MDASAKPSDETSALAAIIAATTWETLMEMESQPAKLLADSWLQRLHEIIKVCCLKLLSKFGAICRIVLDT